MSSPNSILIGEVLNHLMLENEEVHSIVGDKVFPIVAHNDTTFPLVTYQKTGISSSWISKDGLITDVVTFQIVAASKTYLESILLANAIRKAVELRKIETDYLTITDIKMTGITEVFLEEAYVQTMTFNCNCV